MLGLERRLPELAKDIAVLDSENDEQMYAAISLQLINNELWEIQQLTDELNSTTLSYQRLSASATEQVQDLNCLNILLLCRKTALSNWTCVPCPPAGGPERRDGRAGGVRQHAGGKTTTEQPPSDQRPAGVQDRTPAPCPTHPPSTWYVPKQNHLIAPEFSVL